MAMSKTSSYLLSKYHRSFLHISCGDYTYGQPKLQVANSDFPRKLIIGRYTSIAFDCVIFIGRQGRHTINTLSSYPIAALVSANLKEKPDYIKQIEEKNLDVEIGHDVWIGARVTIMAGVKIGIGAVIATGSVVTKDVPAYAVVGGVPSKIIKMRHSDSVIEDLLQLKWWELEPDEIYGVTEGKFNSQDIEDVVSTIKDNVKRADHPE